MARSDADLVRQALAGDREAFGVLVERHRRTIFALALQRGFRAVEADDVAQDVFLRAYESLRRLQDAAAFPRWLYGIAGHVIADAARTRARRREELAPDQFAGIHDVDRTDPTAGEDRDRVFRALDELPAESRLVIVLRYIEGLTPKEIAERLGEPRGTVRSRLHHALEVLQIALGGAPPKRPVAEAREGFRP